ncbi:MAG: replication-associated recombination protein A [bacterium]
MSEIFEEEKNKRKPLSVLLRPTNLDDFVGQKHLLGDGKILWRIITRHLRTNLIIWGPPGTGKTSIGHIIANTTNSEFVQMNATTASVADFRKVIHSAQNRLNVTGRGTILFVDEMHRLTKTQQDALLPDMEEGIITVVGASIHNPFHRLDRALLSRAKVLELKPLTNDDLKKILSNALERSGEWADGRMVEIEEEAKDRFIALSNGDARRMLDTLELIVRGSGSDKVIIDVATVDEFFAERIIDYDQAGDIHYQVASAFIKSMRGSDPDATLYWLARMIEGGEDPEFIARRIVISASEDVGLADPMAICVAVSAIIAVEHIGMPEAIIPLAHSALYVACAPKSNSAYTAMLKALEEVKERPLQKVPLHLQNIPQFALPKGVEYKYPHTFPGGFITQEYLEKKLRLYFPKLIGKEEEIYKRLNKLWADGRFKYKDVE